MGIKDKSKKAAAGASVAIATASLGSCSRPTHGDPPPPPLECNTVDEGESLRATATVTGRELRVMIRNVSYSEWRRPRSRRWVVRHGRSRLARPLP